MYEESCTERATEPTLSGSTAFCKMIFLRTRPSAEQRSQEMNDNGTANAPPPKTWAETRPGRSGDPDILNCVTRTSRQSRRRFTSSEHPIATGASRGCAIFAAGLRNTTQTMVLTAEQRRYCLQEAETAERYAQEKNANAAAE